MKKPCNCKKEKPMNNLRDVDYINQAKLVHQEYIQGKTEFTDIDKVMIFQTYKDLYPASSVQPSLEEAIQQIKTGIELYNVKYKR